MYIIARLREVAPREFVRRNEREHVCVDGRPQRLDRIPQKRVAPFLVRVKVSDRRIDPDRRAIVMRLSRHYALTSITGLLAIWPGPSSPIGTSRSCATARFG